MCGHVCHGIHTYMWSGNNFLELVLFYFMGPEEAAQVIRIGSEFPSDPPRRLQL